MEKARKICWLMGLMLLCGLYCLKLYDIVAISAPHELRETTIAIFAKYFSNGINPYSPQYLLEDEPIATSMYGFVAPLVLAPFVKIFGYLKIFSTLQICELVTLIVEMAGVFFGYMTIRNKTHNSLCSLIGSVFLAACYWRVGGYGGAFPDAWGLTIALYICYLLSGYDEKKHLPLKLALLSILLFYIKQYFVLYSIPIAFFLILRSKKEFFKFALYGFVLGIVSIIIVNDIFPMYFSEAIAVGQGMVSDAGITYSVNQLIKVCFTYFRVNVIVILVAVAIFISKGNVIDGIKKISLIKSYEFFGLWLALPFVIAIARNGGAYLTYYLQLWCPYIIILSMCMLDYVEKNVSARRHAGIIIGYILIIIIGELDCKGFNVARPIRLNEIEDWKTVYSILEKYDNFLVSSELASYCIENEIYTSEYGQADCLDENVRNFVENIKYVDTLFPYAKSIINNNFSYNKKVRENIKNQEYSCLMLNASTTRYWLTNDEILDAGYILTDTKELVLGEQKWSVNIFILP